MAKKKGLSKLWIGSLIGVCVAFVIILLSKAPIFKEQFYLFEAKFYDFRSKLKVINVEEGTAGDLDGDGQGDIVILDIDARSVNKMGRFQQWPRTYYAKLIDYVARDGAAAIGFDMIIDPDRNIYEDSIYVESVARSGIVSNGIELAMADSMNFRYQMLPGEPKELDFSKMVVHFRNEKEVIPKLNQLQRINNEIYRTNQTFYPLLNASRSAGYVNEEPDPDGITRWMPLLMSFNQEAYASFAFRMVLDLLQPQDIEVILGEKIILTLSDSIKFEIPIDDRARMLIDYQGGFRRFRYISYFDVLRQDLTGEPGIPEGFLAGKILFVGTSLAGLFDLRSIPVQPAFPGVEVHANVMQNILAPNFIKIPRLWVQLAILLSIAIVIGIAANYFRALGSAILAFIVLVGYNSYAIWQFLINGIWLNMLDPNLAIFFTFMAVFVYKYLVEDREKRQIRGIFSYYVTKNVVDELLSNPDLVKLGGEKRECTAFFSDIQGFTTISEQLTPEALVSLLNEYLTAMTDLVFKYDGMLDKYEGDAIMAVYGPPVYHPNHAINACLCTLEMQEVLAKMRLRFREEGKPELFARCGINTGPMVVGNMGSQSRFNYTVMGDSVNLASRLEGANKNYGTYMMVGENTYQKAKEALHFRQLDVMRVKGKTEPVKVYELMGKKENGLAPNRLQLIDIYTKGLSQYFLQHWDQALELFDQALKLEPKDTVSKVYLKRCKEFKQNSPGTDWDGVFTLTEK